MLTDYLDALRVAATIFAQKTAFLAKKAEARRLQARHGPISRGLRETKRRRSHDVSKRVTG